jgi:HEAT repeat protein
MKKASPISVFLAACALGGALVIAPASTALALTDEETARAEAVIPLLDGPQELWAIGEFVHMGPPAVPIVAKGLQHQSRRVRHNAIEVLYLIKDKSAVSYLNEVAANRKEVEGVREKALRVAIRLDPVNAVPALQAMASDESVGIRNAVGYESRLVKDKAVIDLLITLLADNAKSVADVAHRTLWGFTGRLVERQDFLQSTKEQRVAWSKDWADWWGENRDRFQFAQEGPTRPQEPYMPPGGFPMPPPMKDQSN